MTAAATRSLHRIVPGGVRQESVDYRRDIFTIDLAGPELLPEPPREPLPEPTPAGAGLVG